MPLNPPNVQTGGFGGGAQQLIAMAQRNSGTKGGGILDSIIGQAFSAVLQKFLQKTPGPDPTDDAITAAYRGAGSGNIGNETGFLYGGRGPSVGGGGGSSYGKYSGHG